MRPRSLSPRRRASDNDSKLRASKAERGRGEARSKSERGREGRRSVSRRRRSKSPFKRWGRSKSPSKHAKQQEAEETPPPQPQPEAESVGSSLSINDQFDIVLPVDPDIMYSSDRNLRAEDDVSSVTTDEYRKYAGLLWRLSHPSAGGGGACGCGGCCGPGSPSDSARTINTGTQAAVAQNGAESEQLVQPQATNEEKEEKEEDADAGVDHGVCWCGSPAQEDPTVEKYPEDTVARKSDRSVDRTMSLFDDALSEADPKDDQTEDTNKARRGSHGRSWKASIARNMPWNRRKSRRASNEVVQESIDHQNMLEQGREEEEQGRSSPTKLSKGGRESPNKQQIASDRDSSTNTGSRVNNSDVRYFGYDDSTKTESVAASYSKSKRRGSLRGSTRQPQEQQLQES